MRSLPHTILYLASLFTFLFFVLTPSSFSNLFPSLSTFLFPIFSSPSFIFSLGFFAAVLLSDSPLFSIARHLAGFRSEHLDIPGGKEKQTYGLHHFLLNMQIPSTWLNLGYWKNTSDFREACENLARKLAEEAKLSANDSVLDVGYGCGDQDLFFWENYSPKEIVGVNFEAAQCWIAQEKMVRKGLNKQIRLYRGSATELSKLTDPTQRFDKILALDCAYHFSTRRQFFEQCLLKLKPTGRICLADIILREKPKTWQDRLVLKLVSMAADIPQENLIDQAEYFAQLASLGFGNTHMIFLDDYVFLGLANFIARHRVDLAPFIRPNLWTRYRFVAEALRYIHSKRLLRYVIVTATLKIEQGGT